MTTEFEYLIAKLDPQYGDIVSLYEETYDTEENAAEDAFLDHGEAVVRRPKVEYEIVRKGEGW